MFGTIDPLIMGDYSHILPAGVPLWAYAIFQTVFCATSATIVSGAMAERTKFSAYCIYSAAISLIIYPISGHWIWGRRLAFAAGLPRFRRFHRGAHGGRPVRFDRRQNPGAPALASMTRTASPRAILGHNMTSAALGVFILWFCWFGFNGASTVGMDTDELMERAGLVFFNTKHVRRPWPAAPL